MGYFDRQTKRVNLVSDPELWVDVYATLTWGELRQFSVDANGNLAVPLDKALPMLLVDWNLPENDGIAPVDEAHINLLKQQDIEAIVGVVNGVIADSTENKSKKKTSPVKSPTKSGDEPKTTPTT